MRIKNNSLIVGALSLVGVFCAALLVSLFDILALPMVLGIIIALAVAVYVFEKPQLALVPIAFLLPFERIGSFEFAGSTVRASQLFALLMLASWIVYGLYKKKLMPAKNPLIILLLSFFAVSVMSFINAVNIERAITVFLFEVFVILVAIAIPNLLQSKELLKKIIVALFVTTIVVSVFGLYQFVGDMIGLPSTLTGLRDLYTKAVFGFPRVQSTALEPLYFGNFLLIPVSLALALFLGKGKKNLPNALVVSALLLGVLNIFLTVSRGAYLGFAVIVILVAFIYIKQFLQPQRFIPLIGLLGVVLLAVFAMFTFQEDNISGLVGQATNFSGGAGIEERFGTFDKSLELFSENPVLGIGVGNFGPRVARNPLEQPEGGWLISNNVYLEILAERGVQGVLLILLLIVFIVVRSIKALGMGKDSFLKTSLVGLTVAFVAICFQYNTFSILYILHVWFLIGLIIAIQNMLLERNESADVQPVSK